MDIKDFRKLVTESNNQGILESIDITIEYIHINSKIELKGIQSIYKFIFNQVVGWNAIENLPPYFIFSKIHFESLKSEIISLITDYSVNSSYQFERNLNDFKDKLTLDNQYNSEFVFMYDAAETDFLVSIYKNNILNFDGAIDYITQTEINYSKSPIYTTGLLLAYEFKHQGESDLTKRRSSEKLNLGKIRNKYNEYIVEAEQQLNSNLSDAKENLTNHFETVDKLKIEKNKNFEEWFTGVQDGFNSFFSNSNESIKTNEDLYREKLRLEAPAKYWKDRGTLLKKEGKNYLNWLIGISVIAAILLFTLLMLLGTDYFEAAFNDKIKGIKWSIILITIVSLLAFTIKILSKMTFSSFHLSRDAEEREQLTHFYLALKKDTTIEPEERQLILQSLFSRADTGLLKEDSSPTMPTSFIEKFAGGR
jgi:hypothetical protein